MIMHDECPDAEDVAALHMGTIVAAAQASRQSRPVEVAHEKNTAGSSASSSSSRPEQETRHQDMMGGSFEMSIFSIVTCSALAPARSVQ